MPWFGGDAIYGALTALNNTEQKSVCTQPTAQPPAAALPSSGFGPLPPWVGQQCPQPLAPIISTVIQRPLAVGVALAVVGLLVWGGLVTLIEKLREGGRHGLRWPPFYQNKQQSNGGRLRR
jgi:hypothetical protein